MTPEERNAAMDRLEKLDKEIAQLEEDVDDEWLYSGSERSLFQFELSKMEKERDELRAKFPELTYWPQEPA